MGCRSLQNSVPALHKTWGYYSRHEIPPQCGRKFGIALPEWLARTINHPLERKSQFRVPSLSTRPVVKRRPTVFPSSGKSRLRTIHEQTSRPCNPLQTRHGHQDPEGVWWESFSEANLAISENFIPPSVDRAYSFHVTPTSLSVDRRATTSFTRRSRPRLLAFGPSGGTDTRNLLSLRSELQISFHT